MPKKFCKCGKSYTGKDRFCKECMTELFNKGRGINKPKKPMLDEKEIEEETEEVEPNLEENPGVDDEGAID